MRLQKTLFFLTALLFKFDSLLLINGDRHRDRIRPKIKPSSHIDRLITRNGGKEGMGKIHLYFDFAIKNGKEKTLPSGKEIRRKVVIQD
ncbi:hypothetical protein BKK51_09910 [Rodentibacter trehalosifermentans]|uniref:Uncharacterized protein n=1 Tax=Rodentibacter trehalosifermentans TaxID=1908263 RepID=A0A1V3J238_9PAST|nr:hypothetical protein BKK51_09910 [Rodentibacter trehalosifermentans]OOF48769.1 hypothetical protein BKK52_05000 [Rodentibacter trehalosifermentans]